MESQSLRLTYRDGIQGQMLFRTGRSQQRSVPNQGGLASRQRCRSQLLSLSSNLPGLSHDYCPLCWSSEIADLWSTVA